MRYGYDPKNYFTNEQIKELRLFGAYVQSHPIPIDDQQTMHGNDGFSWSIDMYSQEVVHALTLKEEDYREYNYSRRFDFYRMVDIEFFLKICYEYKLGSYLELQRNKDFSNMLIVPECGRGVEVLMCTFVKDWDHVFTYDESYETAESCKAYFQSRKESLVLTGACKTHDMMTFNKLIIPTIVYATNHNIEYPKQEEILNNPNLLFIENGRKRISGDQYARNH